MKITSADFKKSALAEKDFLHDLPEIAFVGRSNVGKSSLINALCNRKNLAKTSSTPGKTRLINYFTINKNFYLVDLPGYGYHKAGKSFDEKWAEILETYILHSERLKHIFVLLDIRHEPNSLDIEMLDFLSFNVIPYTIIATKCDKLSKSQINNGKLMLAKCARVGTENIIAVSSKDRYNLNSVLSKLDDCLKIDL